MICFNERDFEIFRWLIYLKHLSLVDIRDYFFDKDVNPRRYPYRKFLRFMKEGYVKTIKIPTESKDLYLATEKAARLLREEGIPLTIGLSKDKEFGHFRHDKMLVSLWILFKRMGLGVFIPERLIRSIKPHGSCPDGIILGNAHAYAIEYERSEKKLERYGQIFESYQTKSQYDFVLYIMESKALINKLEEKFPYRGNVYFITREELVKKEHQAVFRLGEDKLSVFNIYRDARRERLRDLPREFLRKVIAPKDGENWKNEKLDIPWPEENIDWDDEN